ncbi:hypothetical protein PHET_02458 [Paragonimus heterotremus]|uniref:Uncharacterized protein n=1 Tax=Paragonimus heterotremus TaxID=100268 RepID=A0A8J4WTW6_9TREM|nr:hypothetical protein PHET_02458 [Paragonimus heterotremus]
MFFIFKVQTKPWAHKDTSDGEREQSLTVPLYTRSTSGEFGCPRHCGWKPEFNPGSSVDHNSAFSSKLARPALYTRLTQCLTTLAGYPVARCHLFNGLPAQGAFRLNMTKP